MDDIFRYDFWHREMDQYIAKLKKEKEEKKQQAEAKQQVEPPKDEDDDEKGTFEYNDGI